MYHQPVLIALSIGDVHQGIPESYEEAINQNGWKEAIKNELVALEKNYTWDIVPYPNDQEVIDSKWIFKEKNINGQVTKKARLVARGFKQSNIFLQGALFTSCQNDDY